MERHICSCDFCVTGDVLNCPVEAGVVVEEGDSDSDEESEDENEVGHDDDEECRGICSECNKNRTGSCTIHTVNCI